MTARKTSQTAKEIVETSQVAKAQEEQVIQSMIEQVAIETLQSTGKEEVVETAKPEVAEAQEEPESLLPDEMSGVKIICDGLSIDELKGVIEYCSNRIDELQKEEVEALEAEMRAIQSKLMAMRGFRLNPVMGNGNSGQKRADKPLINPKNPAQVYTFGKTPDWLSKWMTETGKTVAELREAQAQAQQSKEEVKAQ